MTTAYTGMLAKFIFVIFSLHLASAALVENDNYHHINTLRPRASLRTQQETVEGLIQRVIGNRSHEFSVQIDPHIGPSDKDTFTLHSDAKANVMITGTSGVAAAWGFYYYISQYGGGHVSWGGNQVNLSVPLPKVPTAGVKVTSNDKFRYFSNTCTMSYSFVWYEWPSWQHLLDWMAMNAINLPLAFVGQEEIWRRVYTKMGFTEDELESHFAGPAFLAWQRMGNMHGWGGPLPRSWMTQQFSLQHQILQRMRDFGMTPVLPAFAGHVPANITRLYPNVKVSHAGDWGGFNKTYCCTTLLDFTDPLFKKIGKNFILEYTREYGTDHVYNCDSFNENTPPTRDPAFIRKAGQAVYSGMVAGDPDALWVMQGWLFLSSGYWTKDLAEALVTSVPLGRMLVLDLPSDVSPQYARLDSYFGQPFIWTMIHSYGGNVALYGAVDNINEWPFQARAFPNSTMVGTGIAMEGINQNDVMYEFMMENTWRKAPRNLTAWFSDYSRRRYGHYDQNVDAAWQLLKRSVYNCTDPITRHGHGRNVIVRRPRFKARIDRSVYNCSTTIRYHGYTVLVLRPSFTSSSSSQVWYEPEDVFSAWDHMVKAAKNFQQSKLFRYDLVDVTRQSLQLMFTKVYTDLIFAYRKKDQDQLRQRADYMFDMLHDLDTVLASDSHFLLGKWLADAKARGDTPAEKQLYEYNARNQITLWGPSGNILDYANKQWSGMISDYYAPRWKLFVSHLVESLISGKPYSKAAYQKDVFQKVEQPFTFSRKIYPTTAKGDAIQIVTSVHSKYRSMTRDNAPYFRQLSKWNKMQGKFLKLSLHWLRKQNRIIKSMNDELDIFI